VSDGIGGFKTIKDAERYYERYDEFAARRWPVAHDELDISTRFGVTRVRRSGPESGVPLLLIHPTTGSSVGWYPLITPLCERRPVLTPDTIGTAGRSVQTAAIRSPGDLFVWRDDVLDGLDVDRAHIIGYSEGGWIAGLHAALTDRPHRLATLTLIEPGGAIARLSQRFITNMIVRGGRALLAKDKRRAVREFSHWMNGDVELTDDQIDCCCSPCARSASDFPRRDHSPMTNSAASRRRRCCSWEPTPSSTTLPSSPHGQADCCPT
jgi:pimeloyl-ACP methyl ester carboxylesterase